MFGEQEDSRSGRPSSRLSTRQQFLDNFLLNDQSGYGDGENVKDSFIKIEIGQKKKSDLFINI